MLALYTHIKISSCKWDPMKLKESLVFLDIPVATYILEINFKSLYREHITNNVVRILTSSIGFVQFKLPESEVSFCSMLIHDHFRVTIACQHQMFITNLPISVVLKVRKYFSMCQ